MQGLCHVRRLSHSRLEYRRQLLLLRSARRKEALQELTAEGMSVIELDVTKPESVKAAIDTYALTTGLSTSCIFAFDVD